MRKIFLSIILGLMLLMPLVSASISEVTAEASSSSVTTGTSVTVTTTVTATGSETSSIQLVSTPSGITISDPATGSYSSVAVSTTPVTKSFTMTAGSAGTYTYYAMAGSTQSTAKTIVFSDPSVLTISGNSTTVIRTGSGQTFTLSITLTNAQASAITSSYELNLPTGYSAAGDPESSTGTSFAVGSTTLTWTITTGSSSGTITFQLGSNTNAFSRSVTINIPATEDATITGTSPGGSSSTTLSTGKTFSKKFSSITSITPRKILSSELSGTNTSLKEIYISVKNRVTSVTITVSKLDKQPASVMHEISGKIYRYINITKSNLADSDIDTAKIKFKIEKTWMNENGLNSSLVNLYRYTNQWEKLNTVKLSETDSEIEYEATTPGFSVFAIGVETPAAAEQIIEEVEGEVVCTPDWTCTEWLGCVNDQQTRTCTDANRCGTNAGKPAESQVCGEQRTDYTWLIVLLIVGIVAGAGYFIAKEKKWIK